MAKRKVKSLTEKYIGKMFLNLFLKNYNPTICVITMKHLEINEINVYIKLIIINFPILRGFLLYIDTKNDKMGKLMHV